MTGNASPSAAPSAAASSSTVTTISSSGAVVSAAASGDTATVTVAGSGSVAASLTTTTPSSIPALQSARSMGKAATARHPLDANGNTPVLYIAITANAATTITGLPQTTITATSLPSGPYYLAYYNGSAWVTIAGPGTALSSSSLTFAAVTFNPSILIAAGSSAYFCVYTGSTLASPAPSPIASASPSPSASASVAPAPSPSPSAAAFVDTACYQSAATTQSGTLTPVTNFFSTVIPNGKTICVSVWDISSNLTNALVTAAHNGANITVIMPYSEYSSDESSVPTLTNAGAHIKWEYTTGSAPAKPTATVTYESAPMDIHAKFALVDGAAYLDGHNFFTTDVVMQDGILADFNAIQADLENFPTPAAEPSPSDSFTTDKQLSLLNESTYLQTIAIPALSGSTPSAAEYDFITESYNPSSSSGYYNDDVYGGMCQIASLASQPTMNVIVEDYSSDSSAVHSALTNLLVLDPNAHVYSTGSGQEKISMVRSSVGGTVTSAWFGSSNATTTDLFDWGIDIPPSNTAMLSALGTYFGTASPASGVLAGAAPIPSPAAGTTPQPCPSIHP